MFVIGGWEDNGSDYSGISEAGEDEDEEFDNNQEGKGKSMLHFLPKRCKCTLFRLIISATILIDFDFRLCRGFLYN